MHELAVTESMLHVVVAEAERAGATRITRITLVIGELTSIIDESVQLYFDSMSEGTRAAGATLEFKYVHATLRCTACGQLFTKEGSGFTCPHCGGAGRLTGDAKEFYIESIEVE